MRGIITVITWEKHGSVMTLYNVAGTISSLLFLGCLVGLVVQIRKVRQRKIADPRGAELGYATQSLSVNGFFSSFIAFYSFLLYSIMLEDIDYYIFFTRLIASLATWIVLFEIFRDRLPLSQRAPFLTASVALLAAFGALFFREEVSHLGEVAAESLAVFATLIILQGGIQQIRKIWQAKCTGALSLPMTLVFFAKDVSNVFFGIVLGLELGWPLILMGAVSGILKLGVTITFLLYPEKLEAEARVGYH